ncbi:MAG: insulinase family protein [Deltaproteobacteria bacterium]|nr:insulinase family protein [Deltaproteobacteria bacterium]
MKQSPYDPVRISLRAGIIGWILAIFVALMPLSDKIPLVFSGKTSSEGISLASADEVNFTLWPHEQSDLSPDSNLVLGKLPNGFRYALMKNKTPLDRVSMHLMVQAGSLNETDDQQGYAHFLEHLEFCGSTHFKPGELIRYFQSIGMDFGADANARTGFTDTVYDVLLPNGSRQSLADGLKVMRDFAGGALLLPDEIDRERKVVLAEKLTRDSSSYRTFESSLKFSFPDSLISRRLPIGDETVLKKADHAALKRFYDIWYRPETMILVAVGDLDPAIGVGLIEEAFSSLSFRAEGMPAPDIGKIDHQGAKAFYHYEAESGTAAVSIGTLYRGKNVPDSIQFQKEEALKALADKIMQNRLDALIRKPGTPFTSASVHSGRFMKGIYVAEISAESDPENWQKSLSTIEQQLRSALEYGFLDTEVVRVKADFLSSLEDQEKKASTRNSQSIARQIIEALDQNQVIQSPAQRKALLAPFVQSLTAKDVLESLKSAWSRDHRLIELTGNVRLADSDGVLPEKQILDVWNQSQGVSVFPPVEYRPVSFPYFAVPDVPGPIRERREIVDLGIIQVDFANGIRLNLKKTDFKQNQVMANLVFGSGSASEPLNKPGLSQLTAEVIQESGLGGLTREELDRALAGKNTQIRFSVGEDRFMFKASSVSDEIPLLFQLFRAHILDPGFRQDAYSLCMERFAQQYQELSRTVDGMARLHARRFLAGGDSRFGLPAYEAFRTLKLEDVRAWLMPALQQDALEISIAGDMDVNAVIELASTYLGTLPERSTRFLPPPVTSPKFPAGGTLTLQVVTDIPKTLVMIAYPTEDFWDIQRTRRLSVLAEVFSDRLRENVREKLGAAYSPMAFNHPSRAYPEYGVFQTMITVELGDVKRVIHEVQSIAAALSEKPVPDDELHRSLDPVLTGIKDLIRTNDYWVNSVLTSSAGHPQQIDWSRTIQKDYASVSSLELHLLAQKYLGQPKPAIIVIQPEKSTKQE